MNIIPGFRLHAGIARIAQVFHELTYGSNTNSCTYPNGKKLALLDSSASGTTIY